MKTRKSGWIDLNTLQPIYGIQVFYNGQWLNGMADGKPLLFATEAERDAKRKELQARLPAKPEVQ